MTGRPGLATRESATAGIEPGERYAPPARSAVERDSMATLAFNFEEIVPRELKPSLLELDGISRASVEAHYRLYEGYVNK